MSEIAGIISGISVYVLIMYGVFCLYRNHTTRSKIVRLFERLYSIVNWSIIALLAILPILTVFAFVLADLPDYVLSNDAKAYAFQLCISEMMLLVQIFAVYIMMTFIYYHSVSSSRIAKYQLEKRIEQFKFI